jgi:hypothetical protein
MASAGCTVGAEVGAAVRRSLNDIVGATVRSAVPMALENESVAADQGDPNDKDPNRRDFIHIAAGAAAVGAGVMAAM